MNIQWQFEEMVVVGHQCGESGLDPAHEKLHLRRRRRPFALLIILTTRIFSTTVSLTRAEEMQKCSRMMAGGDQARTCVWGQMDVVPWSLLLDDVCDSSPSSAPDINLVAKAKPDMLVTIGRRMQSTLQTRDLAEIKLNQFPPGPAQKVVARREISGVIREQK